MIHKTCKTCGICKAQSEFARISANGFRGECQSCRNLYMKLSQQKSRERKRFGIEVELPDRSYTPPTPEQFLPMPPPLVQVALVWTIAPQGLAA